ncbi:LPXTG cell wall anchor domain-containing protein [Actinobacteria bacterium YIM 96077]|uniref:Htaa domain-containing protein n=1 Tax=Phytoactinopolyspora halophila TaxID=1981511 RepID=A0A329QF33_9ACTN|nr:HtaA domain-containing protein [Phytoactinopolyspora halophila]AYY12668.1 LPXTG cell wall anchor domain-containing protein [Actinobacteria bacterium YIM 96077]RAW10581.1 hypothetical protein DPM12_18725 [Phytoactinopolyspora halophila]
MTTTHSRRHAGRAAATGLTATLVAATLATAGAATPDADTDADARAGAAISDEVSAGELTWGLRESYRNYIAGPIAGGEIVTSDGAEWLDGPGNARGPFTFPNASGTADPETGTGEIAFEGQVYTWGHDYGDGPILELTISNVRLQLDGDGATLVVDAEYRPFAGADPGLEPPETVEATDLAFATVDLSTADLTPDEDGVVTVEEAPTTGVLEAMEAIGWDEFYSAELPDIELDPVSFTATLEPDDEEPDPEWDPVVEVFAADGETPLGDTEVTAGEEIVVRGSGFDPEANPAARQPVPEGLPAGVYVVFGAFADQWQPSLGAGSDARTVLDQRWAMTRATLDEVPERYRDAILDEYVELTPDGTFEATLTVSTDGDAAGNYGVYTYAAGGAVTAEHEFGIPVTVADDGEETPEPGIEVSKTANLDPYADSIIVTGTGFAPGDLESGLRVGIGPEAGDGPVPELDPALTLEPGNDEHALGDDGSFEVELQTVDVEPGATLAVHTAPVDGDAHPAYTTSTPISFADARTPELTVEPATDIEVGQEIEVTGTGYAPNRPISVAITANTSTHEEYGWPTGWLAHGVVRADADGNLSRTFTVPGTVTGSGEDCLQERCYVASFSSAQAEDATPIDYRADRSQDVLVPVTFADAQPDPDPDPEPELTISPSTVVQGEDVTFHGDGLPAGETAQVTVSTEPGSTAGDGTLDWGVRESFRDYIEGGVANGSIEVHDPATRNDDGTFRFADGEGHVDSDRAELSFAGQIHFAGHDHGQGPLLELTITDPQVVIDGDTGVLVADVASKSLDSGEIVEYPEVDFAALDLSDHPLNVDDGTASATDVPATLTAGGVPAFADFYEEGAELDPLSFAVTVTDGQAVDVGSTSVDDAGAAELTWTVPGDFPLGTATAALTAGQVELSGEFTIEPGEPAGDENGNGDDDGSGNGPGNDPGGTGDGDDGTGDDTLPDTGTGTASLLLLGTLILCTGAAICTLRRRFGTA